MAEMKALAGPIQRPRDGMVAGTPHKLRINSYIRLAF
jgi:hypothetical protein